VSEVSSANVMNDEALTLAYVRTARSCTGTPVQWHALASVKAAVLFVGPVPLPTPGPKVGLGSPCREHLPRRFEVGSGPVEGRRSAGEVFTGLRSRIETAAPALLIDFDRHTGAFADGADMRVAIVDVPGLLVDFRIAAVGEGGHAPSKRARGRLANCQSMAAHRAVDIQRLGAVDGDRDC
jgi:hypothetical protein